MAYNAAIDALLRRKMLESIYERMTDDEKRLFIQLTMQQKSTDDIMAALAQQQQQLQALRNGQQTFVEDFSSNILGNAAWDGAVWLIRRLSKLI